VQLAGQGFADARGRTGDQDGHAGDAAHASYDGGRCAMTTGTVRYLYMRGPAP
jgi:hypothetical protein